MKKKIIVTGSEGLIGYSLVNFLRLKKNKVFGIDIIKKSKINYFKCDITNEEQVNNSFSKIFEKNKIDILINNAAFNPPSNSRQYKFSDYSLSKWKKNLEVDLIGSFLTAKYACKYFEKYNKGLIINISSIYGVVGPDQNIYQKKNKKYFGFKPIEYSLTKSALIGYTKALASFYKNTNIRVICLVLGGIETKNMSSYFKKNYKKKTISNRMARVGEYNEIINFFCSDKANYINGSCIVVDGGATSIL